MSARTSSDIPAGGISGLFFRKGAGFAAVAVFSLVTNVLALTGPIFMIQVYDRVLGSRSVETLVVLTIIAVVLLAVAGYVESLRSRLLARIGIGWKALVDMPVSERIVALRSDPHSANSDSLKLAAGARTDVDSVVRMVTAPGFGAVFDLPFSPVFIFVLFAFHPVLGGFAVAGMLGSILCALLASWLSRLPVTRAGLAHRAANVLHGHLAGDASVLRALGMQQNMLMRAENAEARADMATLGATDVAAVVAGWSRAYRAALQSVMLAVAAWLVVRGDLSAGAMFAASTIFGRAIAPVDQMVGQWNTIARGLVSLESVSRLLAIAVPDRTANWMPRPDGELAVAELTRAGSGGKPVLHDISFVLPAGKAVGIIGLSGAGKSSLVRILAGIDAPSMGAITLGGVPTSRYGTDGFGRLVGYLPQEVTLFSGTVAENIARMDRNPNPKAVVDAAKAAGAHDMIMALEKGYDTRIDAGAVSLSSGQRQRIGLARALYGDPVLLLLDEPNSNLDTVGTAAINAAIRSVKERGGSAVIVPHRPAALNECDFLLHLRAGRIVAFGPRSSILAPHSAGDQDPAQVQEMPSNVTQISQMREGRAG